jgi:hypothetical protein
MVAVLLMFVIAGCGGGGQSAKITTDAVADFAGIYALQNVGLPNDQLLVDESGNVMVSVSLSKSTVVRYRIGKCASSGRFAVSGTWQESYNTSRTIVGTGNIANGTIKISATVTSGSNTATITVDGYELELPPPPPYGNADINVYEDLDIPPSPPY